MPCAATRWGVVALSILSGIVAAAHIGKLPPALPMLRRELGLDMITAGWVVSTISTTAALVGVAAGLLADRIGHRRLSLAGLALLAAGGLAGAAAHGAPLLLASRLVEGLGFLCVVVAAPTLILAASGPGHQRLTLGMWGVYMPIGLAATLAAAPLALDAVGWRALWLAVAAAALVCLAVMAPATRGLAPARAGLRWGDVLATLRRPGPWLLSLCFLSFACQFGGIMMWLPSFLIEQRGLAGLAAAGLTALVIAAGVPAIFLGSWLIHRNVPRWLLMSVAHVAMGLTAQMVFAEAWSDGWRFVACVAFSFIGGVLPPAAFSATPLHAASPRHLGTVSGMFAQGSNIGQLIGPPLVAACVTWTGGWTAIGPMVAAWAVLGVAVSLGTGWVEHRMALARAL